MELSFMRRGIPCGVTVMLTYCNRRKKIGLKIGSPTFGQIKDRTIPSDNFSAIKIEVTQSNHGATPAIVTSK